MCIRDSQHVERVAHMEADILQPVRLHMLQGTDHAVDERLAADKAMIGMQLRLSREMLARAEADLQLQGPIIAEQDTGIERAFGNADAGQQVLDQSGLPDAQLVPLAPAVKPADCCRVAHPASG